MPLCNGKHQSENDCDANDWIDGQRVLITMSEDKSVMVSILDQHTGNICDALHIINVETIMLIDESEDKLERIHALDGDLCLEFKEE